MDGWQLHNAFFQVAYTLLSSENFYISLPPFPINEKCVVFIWIGLLRALLLPQLDCQDDYQSACRFSAESFITKLPTSCSYVQSHLLYRKGSVLLSTVGGSFTGTIHYLLLLQPLCSPSCLQVLHHWHYIINNWHFSTMQNRLGSSYKLLL